MRRAMLNEVRRMRGMLPSIEDAGSCNCGLIVIRLADEEPPLCCPRCGKQQPEQVVITEAVVSATGGVCQTVEQ
jgi:hypothetical protein